MDRRGGRRAGSGRPTKAQALAKARVLAETIKRGPKVLPRQYLQGLLDSPASSKSERLRAAELLLKLLPESRSDVGSPTGAVSETPLRVYSVPRGSRIDMKTGQIVFPEGVEPEPLEPYDATPQLTLSDQSEYKRERFEVAETEPPANLVRLDVYKSKHDDGDGDSEPPGAA